MTPNIIAILIIAGALVLYLFPKIPVWVTTVLAALAMVYFGILDFGGAFAGFGNAATLLIIGMMIMGQACFTTGLADRLSKMAGRFAKSEKIFVMALLIVGTVLAMFLNGALVVPLLMAVANVTIKNSNGAITRKGTYMPIAFASVLGNNLTAISASSMVSAASIIVAAGYKQLGMFEVTAITLPGVLLFYLFYWFYGHKLSHKVFDFPEIPLDDGGSSADGEKVYPVWKQVLTVAVFVVVVVAIARGGNFGQWSLMGACVLILSGCISAKEAIKAVDWPTYIIASAALGMAAGMNSSGGGATIAEFITGICGPLSQNPWGMCIVMFIIATLLTQVMSDGATVAIVVPIGLAMAQAMGWDAIPIAISAAAGAKVGLATPICVSCMTMVAPAGYRFKDYFVIGGIQNVIQLLATAVMLKIVYF